MSGNHSFQRVNLTMDEKCCVSHVTRKASKLSHKKEGSFLRSSICLIRQATLVSNKQILAL